MATIVRFDRGLLVLLGLGVLGACGGGSGTPPPPPSQGDRVQCACSCTNRCVIYETTTDPDGSNERVTGNCQSGVPGTPATMDVTGSRCVVRPGGQPSTPEARASACSPGCVAQQRNFSVVSLTTQRTLAWTALPDPRTCVAKTTNTVSGVSENSCEVPEGQTTSPLVASSGGNPASAELPVQPALSSVAVRNGFDVATFRPTSGAIGIEGGNCPNETCDIAVTLLTVAAPDFQLSGRSIQNVKVDNETVFFGSKAADGSLSFDLSTVSLVVVANIDSQRTTVQFFPDTGQPTGFYDPITARFSLTADFVRTGGTPAENQSLSLTLQGFVDERPPLANAGPDWTVSCGGGVTLDGTASTDPNNDIVSFVWGEGGTVLATTALAQATLTSPGAHDITLVVTDSTGRADSDLVRLTAVDNTPPRFTFVPPAVTVTDCKSTISIGQATAVDDCGSAVTITNNAPATFPVGNTMVTWTARDALGNTVTATQMVTVPLGNNPACCPLGTNVVVLTSSNDTFTGTAGADCILGLGGQDQISGGGGNDVISGGDGDDIINGGTGTDRLFGGTGQDQVNGGDGNDQLSGGDGDDRVNGDAGDDVMSGGQGQDRMTGGIGNDTLVGNDGDDTLDGGDGNDVLDGSGLHDLCIGGSGTNTFLICERRQ